MEKVLLNINESKLATYERNPERYCEEIKAMNRQMWSEWDAEYQKHKPFITPDMTVEQFARKCQEETRKALLMNRVIILNGKVSRMEYRQWRDVHRQQPVRKATSLCHPIAAKYIETAERYEAQHYLKQFFVMGQA